jgi:ADP-heptose:LPS heptosyltransferase
LSGVARATCVADLNGLAALDAFFAAAARKGALFVGCDSGPMHLAWAAGMRVVLLAGPQDERRTGPWPVPRSGSPLASSAERAHEHAIVRAGMQPSCAPCLSRRCTHPEGNVCMTRIDPSRVGALVRAAGIGGATLGTAHGSRAEGTQATSLRHVQRV